MQPTKPADIPYGLLGQMERDTPPQGLPGDQAASENQVATQDLTTAYITTLYYSALSNLYLQSRLPADIAKVDEENPRLKIAVERSYADFTLAAGWLAKNGGEFIGTSTAKPYYDEVIAMDNGSVKDIAAFYAQKAG